MECSGSGVLLAQAVFSQLTCLDTRCRNNRGAPTASTLTQILAQTEKVTPLRAFEWIRWIAAAHDRPLRVEAV